MKADLKVHFYLRKTNEKKNGECPVIGKITIGKDVAQFSAKITAKVSLWDVVSGRVTGKSKHAIETNEVLDKINVAINASFRKLQEHGIKITASNVKNTFQGIASEQETLIKFFTHYNEEFNKRVGVNRELSTYRQYEFSLQHLKRFISLKYKLSDIPFPQLDFSFIEKYDYYLRIELKRKPNTIIGIVSHLRRMIKYAIGEGIISRDPFEGYVPLRAKPVQKYLTREELNRIISTALDHPCRYLTRDMFLFSVFTGLAFSDVKDLSPEHLVRDNKGELWIRKNRQKTKVMCNIPVLPVAASILDKYKDVAECTGKLLPVLCNQRMNSYLKEIADMCGIHKNLSTHTARHSFATETCLSNGVPIETISKMMGHSNIRTTQIYAEITNQKVSRDFGILSKKTKDAYVIPDDKMPSRVYQCGRYRGWKDEVMQE